MSTAKAEVESLLHKLIDDCSLEDIQYHLYAMDNKPTNEAFSMMSPRNSSLPCERKIALPLSTKKSDLRSP